MAKVWLAEITAHPGGSPDPIVLRVASVPGYNHPSAPGYYPPSIKQPALLRRHIVAQGRIFGESEVSYGELVIENIDGRYDEYLTYGYGESAVLLLGDTADDYGDFVPVITGTVEQPTGNDREIVFRFRDRQLELDLPVSPATYAGDNLESPSTGIEGTPDDIKGQNKIRLFGVVKNADADPVGVFDNVFALNHDKVDDSEAIAAVDAVRVNGAPWDFGADRANLAALFAATPAQGDYDTALSLGLIKLGGTIGQGQVTVDATEIGGSPADQNHIAHLLQRLLLDAGVASGDIVSADVAQLAMDAPYNAGVVVRTENYREVIDAIRAGAAAWVAPNRLGQYNMRQIQEPSGSPVATFRRFDYPNVAGEDDFAIKRLERLVSNDDGRGVPVWQVTVNYLRLWSVQSADALADSLSEEDKAFYSREFRSITVEDTSIQAQFPLAGSLTVDTLLTEEADAQALAEHILSLVGVRRDLYRLVADYDVPLAEAVDLGDVVQVYYPRFGLSGGKLFNVHGIQYDARKFEVELELWG